MPEIQDKTYFDEAKLSKKSLMLLHKLRLMGPAHSSGVYEHPLGAKEGGYIAWINFMNIGGKSPNGGNWNVYESTPDKAVEKLYNEIIGWKRRSAEVPEEIS